jgi:hypothetical protein
MKDNSNLFDAVEVVKDSVDVSLETELLDIKYDLAGMSVSLDDINTLSIKHENNPLGVSVSYENDVVAPMITLDFSNNENTKIDEKEIVDAALEEYEKSIQKEGDRS